MQNLELIKLRHMNSSVIHTLGGHSTLWEVLWRKINQSQGPLKLDVISNESQQVNG